MHRRVATVVATGALLLPVAQEAATASAPARISVRPIKRVVTQTFKGPTVNADRWGTVQVTITVRKTTSITGNRKRVTRRYINLGGGYTTTPAAPSTSCRNRCRPPPGVPPGAERERRHGLRRDLHERGVPAIARGRGSAGEEELTVADLPGLRRVEQIMGMPIVVDVRDDEHGAAGILDELFDWFTWVDATFSTFKDDSEIGRLNRGTLALANAHSRRQVGARTL